MLRINDLDKLRVGAVGETFVVFKERPDSLDLQFGCTVNINNSMRIAHGDTGHLILCACSSLKTGLFLPNKDGLRDDRRFVRRHRDFLCLQDRRPHVDADRLDQLSSVLCLPGI